MMGEDEKMVVVEEQVRERLKTAGGDESVWSLMEASGIPTRRDDVELERRPACS